MTEAPPKTATFEARLADLARLGLVPYVATSEALLGAVDLRPLGGAPRVFLLERAEDRSFHEAYLFANALGFGDGDLKMPNWVLVDCVLMQSAIIGFGIEKQAAPAALLEAFAKEASLNLADLDFLPVSGQIAGLALGGEMLVGFSLFSLRRFFAGAPALGILTKAIALLAYGAHAREKFVGISHWDNKALAMHGRFGDPMWIESPAIPLHPRRSMALVYGMRINFAPDRLLTPQVPGAYDFLLRADDEAEKARIARDMRASKRFIIAPPYQIEDKDMIHLPIRVEAKP